MKKSFLLKITAIFLIVAGLLSCSDKLKNEKVYYWSDGRKIWLDIDYSRMIVEFDCEENLEAYISSNSLSSRMPTELPLAIVPSDKRLDIERTIVRKMFAHKFHQTETPFYLTGNILLEPKEGITIGEIINKFGIDGEITREMSGGSVTIRLNNWDVIMDVANAIYESGMVEWCHPDFATIMNNFGTTSVSFVPLRLCVGNSAQRHKDTEDTEIFETYVF